MAYYIRKIVWDVACFVCFSGLVGAQQVERPVVQAGGVFQVNDAAVTSSEIIHTLLENMREPLQEWRGTLDPNEFLRKAQEPVVRASMAQVYNLLLYQHAKKDFAENENYNAMIKAALEEHRMKIVHQYGGNEAEARLRLRETGMTLEKLLEEFRRELVIASYRQTYFLPTLKITRAQMLQYYRKHLKEKYTQKRQIQFQLIDVPTGGDSEEAHRRAQEAYEKILAGEKFSQLVGEYSDGFRKKQEGIWRPMDPESLSELYQPVATALEKIELGQTTGMIEGSGHVFIAKLIARQESGQSPFSQVQEEIKEALTTQKWIKYRKQLDRALLEKATLGNLEHFVLLTCLELYHRLGRYENHAKG